MRDSRNEKEVNIPRILDQLEPHFRKKLVFAVALRTLANGLDLVAVIGVGFLAVVLSRFALSSGDLSINLGSLFTITASVPLVMTIALAICVLFVSKSLFAIWFNFWLGKQIVDVEVKSVEKFVSMDKWLHWNRTDLSTFQNLVLNSFNALFSGVLMAGVSVVSEGSLLLVLILGFFVVNPLATLALSIYLGGILFLLQRVFTIRSQRQSRVRSAASISLLEATRSYRNTVNEANLAGKTQYWIQAISTQKLVWAQSTIRLNIYAGFPRYVIESALILGIFLFTAAVVTFSDIPSQALTLGVFLTGGLRIVASLLPFQSALAAFSQNRAAGEPALTALETARVPIVLNESETASSRKVPKATVPTISVTDVKVVSNEGKTLLDGVTFEVPFGAKVAIIGPSGAGKTTLLRAMLGFEPLADGRVSYGGVDPESYWSQHPGSISYVPQRPFLFSGSARENIELGEQVAKNHFDSVISSCGLEDVIENDAKLDSPGGAPGVEYSGGETQRIGLARALISQPEVLFLDEATSALDIRSEQAISNTIDALRGNCTVIIVAHRLPTVRNSDLVIYLENGKVRASGTFDDVVARIPDLQKNSAIVD